jgi:hypothetical protein
VIGVKKVCVLGVKVHDGVCVCLAPDDCGNRSTQCTHAWELRYMMGSAFV